MTNAPERFDVFFSYNNQDHLAVEAIARRLNEQGLTVFLDRWYLIAGMPWPEHLEEVLSRCRSVAVFVGIHGIGRWQQREKDLALDRQARERSFPVIPVLLPHADPGLGFLSLNTWVDFSGGINDVGSLEQLVAAVRGEPLRRGAGTLSEICPYRGLHFFREEDAPLFFGRSAFIERLVAAVGRKPLVAVVGASGSGKSSVVRAGLVPRLRARGGERVWDIVTMVPNDRPLHTLCAALLPLLEPEMNETDLLLQTGKLAGGIGSGEVRLRDIVQRALAKQSGTDRLLLVVDQSEELFTLTRAEDARLKFFNEILDATSSSALSVVFTLRADFVKDILAYPSLSDRLQDAMVYVSAMTGEELRQVVELPASKSGLGFEAGLVERIVEKVEGRPGNLPLLEFVLTQLWERRMRDVLTHAAYEEIGQVQGAIATHADKVLADLSPAEQIIARRIFLQLVRPAAPSGDSPEEEPKDGHARRRATFAELGSEKLPVVRKLADAHLLVTGRNEATGEEIVDLVHEALIEEWDTLRSWIESDRLFLTWREQLRALRSFSGGARARVLLTGHLLPEATGWLRHRGEDLSPPERTYIEESIAARRRQIRLQSAVGIFLALAFAAVVYVAFLRPPQPPPTEEPITTTTVAPIPQPVMKEAEETADFPPISQVRVPYSTPVTIPVVVHVLHHTAEENISDEQIRSQIDALNRDFRTRNPDIANVPPPFRKFIGDSMIEFSLARVTRARTDRSSFQADDSMKDPARGGVAAWHPDRYLNIWVCNLDPVLGYSSFPGNSPDKDGCVIDFESFGTMGTARTPGFARGRVAVDAIGHYLNLRHIWGDSPCGDDRVADTPPQERPNNGQPAFPHISCNNGPNGDMFMNFMDYTSDDTRVMFTKGQVLRMHQTLQGKRRTLIEQ